MTSAVRSLEPHPSLRWAVDSYWQVDQPRARASRLPALGYPILEIALGERWLHRPSRAAWATRHGDALLALATRHAWVEPLGHLRSVVVRLEPWAARALLGETLAADAIVDPTELWGSRFETLRDRVGNARDAREVKGHLDRFLGVLLERPRREVDPRLCRALTTLVGRRGDLAISTVATELGIGLRRMEQLFRDGLGVTAKTYARIARFQAALAAYRPGQSIVDLASACGYYDQSHLVRDFRRFAGEAPGELLARRKAGHLRASCLYASRPGA